MQHFMLLNSPVHGYGLTVFPGETALNSAYERRSIKEEGRQICWEPCSCDEATANLGGFGVSWWAALLFLMSYLPASSQSWHNLDRESMFPRELS